MRYSLIEIRYRDGKWQVTFSTDFLDREKSEITPHNLGFMYYPASWDQEKAFTILRDHLVNKHQQTIGELQESVVELQQLTIPHDSKKKRKSR